MPGKVISISGNRLIEFSQLYEANNYCQDPVGVWTEIDRGLVKILQLLVDTFHKKSAGWIYLLQHNFELCVWDAMLDYQSLSCW